jgi:hypothetical protein
MYSIGLSLKKGGVGDIARKQEAGSADTLGDTDVYCMDCRYQLHSSHDILVSAPLDWTHEISVCKR